MFPYRLVRPVFGVLALVAVFGCDRPPSADGLSEWTPSDHDRAEEKQRAQSGQQAGPKGSADEGEQLVEITWQQRCLTCHGPYGRGDGPQGPMLKAPDLTREEWQAKVTDQDILDRIRNGKGPMPPNGDLSPQLLSGLLGRIRAYRGIKDVPQ